MEVNFKDEALEELYYTGFTKDRRYRKICRSDRLVKGYQRAVRSMFNSPSTETLKQLSFLHYEQLRYSNLSSVRIVNGSIERLLFTESEDGIEVELIEIDDTHYGNK